ncbi:MAG: DUF1963 domain-containing protein [Saprospiraceae bacterium]|nr:DUF1963 domain-containing protein [Saprospiraceae bacterium]MCB0542433.1 DUF1963 domain-containing protein [Saprospiraceae bacterium]MCB0573789.1 DUF1963 domain-containing protein [Saprospiraceae bacterium]MCB9356859.1 DUF1963 domain-containing protein [Lewinellaceae bacterium]
MSQPLSLPPAMEPFREQLLRTTLPFIRATAQASRATTPWESKVGGQPYLPQGIAWPASSDGRDLFFLAQINFADLPALLPFPQQGILQFYINDDDLYGMDFDDGANQDNFRVLYHREPVRDESRLQAPAPMLRDYDDLLPHHPDESYPLAFELSEEVAGMTDYRFYQQFGADFFQQFGPQEWDVMDAFGKAVRPQGHKIGGYAYFTQDDPRQAGDPMLLLLQLDSDEHMDLMWGDMGVGHFFIREKDLLALDFSRVLYDWDCL